MKQLLLILAFLLPLCAYPQLKEPFNGPELHRITLGRVI